MRNAGYIGQFEYVPLEYEAVQIELQQIEVGANPNNDPLQRIVSKSMIIGGLVLGAGGIIASIVAFGDFHSSAKVAAVGVSLLVGGACTILGGVIANRVTC